MDFEKQHQPKLWTPQEYERFKDDRDQKDAWFVDQWRPDQESWPSPTHVKLMTANFELDPRTSIHSCDHHNIFDPCFRPFLASKFPNVLYRAPAWPMKSGVYIGKNTMTPSPLGPFGVAPHDPVLGLSDKYPYLNKNQLIERQLCGLPLVQGPPVFDVEGAPTEYRLEVAAIQRSRGRHTPPGTLEELEDDGPNRKYATLREIAALKRIKEHVPPNPRGKKNSGSPAYPL